VLDAIAVTTTSVNPSPVLNGDMPAEFLRSIADLVEDFPFQIKQRGSRRLYFETPTKQLTAATANLCS
jgi:hypothetical protein